MERSEIARWVDKRPITSRMEPNDARKSSDPFPGPPTRGCGCKIANDRQGVSVVRRRVERVGEQRIPRLQSLCDAEPDLGENVLSGTRDP